MKGIEHDALMERLMQKKRNMAIMIALLVIAFGGYLIFARPLLRAYI